MKIYELFKGFIKPGESLANGIFERKIYNLIKQKEVIFYFYNKHESSIYNSERNNLWIAAFYKYKKEYCYMCGWKRDHGTTISIDIPLTKDNDNNYTYWLKQKGNKLKILNKKEYRLMFDLMIIDKI